MSRVCNTHAEYYLERLKRRGGDKGVHESVMFKSFLNINTVWRCKQTRTGPRKNFGGFLRAFYDNSVGKICLQCLQKLTDSAARTRCISHILHEGEVNVFLCFINHTMKTNNGVNTWFHHYLPQHYMYVSDQLHAWPPYPRENAPGTH
jgi:hypothetical protein